MSVRDRDNFKKVFGPLIVLTFWFFVTKLPRSFLIFDTLSVKNLPKELDQVEVVNIVQHFVHSINIFYCLKSQFVLGLLVVLFCST